jgi:hypothetical protein
MFPRLLVASTLIVAGVAMASNVASAGEREQPREEPHHGMDVDNTALGFGIQGEHFNGLPVDAGTIPGPTRGPAVKLDDEEAIDAKDDNPDPAMGAAGPSPLGMPDPADSADH